MYHMILKFREQVVKLVLRERGDDNTKVRKMATTRPSPELTWVQSVIELYISVRQKNHRII